MPSDCRVSQRPQGLWVQFFGYPKDPKVLNNTYKDLKTEIDHIQNEYQELQTFCHKDDETDGLDKLYLKSAEHKEFLKRCSDTYFPSYEKIGKLKNKLITLLNQPINYDSKTNIAKKYPALCRKIVGIEIDHALILKLYNTDLKFVPYNSHLNSLAHNLVLNPSRAFFNYISSKTGSKINALAILSFGIYATYYFKSNGAITTALHTSGFIVGYMAKNLASGWIRSYS
ncbi:MAG: hypothetical protein K940chlam1_00721 [Candidatus Anoxychlamydiales bacterium]|nr:hypothetical protein [Candidatus Anoxychlamydiales bacterium]NGX36582.1 hypothetical protein [Candidatus Anoxychlamydiales bacterium]